MLKDAVGKMLSDEHPYVRSSALPVMQALWMPEEIRPHIPAIVLLLNHDRYVTRIALQLLRTCSSEDLSPHAPAIAQLMMSDDKLGIRCSAWLICTRIIWFACYILVLDRIAGAV